MIDSFAAWIRQLDEEIIQAEYGYEPGEFTVYPDLWRGAFDSGKTPLEAFKSALKAFDEDRKRRTNQRGRRMSYEDLIARLRDLDAKSETWTINDEAADALEHMAQSHDVLVAEIATLQAEIAAARENHAEAEKECDRLHASEFKWRSKFIDAYAGAEAAEARADLETKFMSAFHMIDAKTAEEHASKWMDANFAEAIYIVKGSNREIIKSALTTAFQVAEARGVLSAEARVKELEADLQHSEQCREELLAEKNGLHDRDGYLRRFGGRR